MITCGHAQIFMGVVMYIGVYCLSTHCYKHMLLTIFYQPSKIRLRELAIIYITIDPSPEGGWDLVLLSAGQ